MSKVKDDLHRHRKAVITVVLCVCLACGGLIYHAAGQTEVTASITLTYEGASSGLNPDGTLIHPYTSMVGEDVLTAARKASGVNFDNSDIWLRPSYYGNGETYATKYNIVYTGPQGVKVLKAVLDAWSSNFEKHTGHNTGILDYEKPDTDLDYLYMTDWLDKEVLQIERYASDKQKSQDLSWTPDEAEMTYADVVQAAENIRNTGIADLRTYITQNGISKDTDDTKASVSYENRILQQQKDQADAQYTNRKNAISLYDATIFASSNISFFDETQKQYRIVMARTGLDTLYDEASDFNKNSLSLQTQITENTLLTANMKSAPTADQLSTADSREKDIIGQINTLAKNLKETDAEYEKDNESFYSASVNGESYTPNAEGEAS